MVTQMDPHFHAGFYLSKQVGCFLLDLYSSLQSNLLQGGFVAKL